MALVPELISLVGSFILSDVALLLLGPGCFLGVSVHASLSQQHSSVLCNVDVPAGLIRGWVGVSIGVYVAFLSCAH